MSVSLGKYRKNIEVTCISLRQNVFNHARDMGIGVSSDLNKLFAET